MAKRPVFTVSDKPQYYQEYLIDFTFFSGFSEQQKRRSIESLHTSWLNKHPNSKILEISTKSIESLGKQLSAFNLPIIINGSQTTLESAFQAGKVFLNGGPYTDLLSAPSYIAKKDIRLRESGPLIRFISENVEFPLEPKTFFYDWLYVNAINQFEDIADKICTYDAFTDIEFNPSKSINCQARSAAIFVSLKRNGLLECALKSPEAFKETVYYGKMQFEQISLF